jgi:Tat protein translocase TatB subunit
MNFLGIGTGELLLILLIVLLVMGPERLPQLIRQWAKIVKTLSQFTRTWQQFNAELNRQLTLEDLAGQQPRPAPKPAATPPPPVPKPGPSDNSIAPPELAELDTTSDPAPTDVENALISSSSRIHDPALLASVERRITDPPGAGASGSLTSHGQQAVTPSTAAAEEPRHEQ